MFITFPQCLKKQKYILKMIHLVCGAGIRTHDLLIISHLLEPLDQSSRPYVRGLFAVREEAKILLKNGTIPASFFLLFEALNNKL